MYIFRPRLQMVLKYSFLIPYEYKSSSNIIIYLQVGGILALFLGISIISILECFCYLFYGLKKCCCSCFSDESDEDDNDAVEPLGIRRQQNWNRQSQPANQASR